MKTIVIILFVFTIGSSYSQSLPDFSFTASDGVTLNKASLPSGKSVIVIYSDPFCKPCIKQAEIIKNALNRFTNTTIIWAGWAELADLKDFKTTYFKSSKNVIAAKDEQFKFDTWFGYCEAPTIFVYNPTWKLSAKFVKETSADDLLKALK